MKLANKIYPYLIPVLIGLFSLLIFFITVRGVPGNPDVTKIKGVLDQAAQPFELSPERGRYLLTVSLAEDKSFALSKTLADIAYPDVGYYDGRFYIYFAPGISILALPGYILGKQIGLAQVMAYMSIALFASLNMVVLYLISRNILRLSPALSIFAAMIFGFGSVAWSYSGTMYQHHVTTFFILSSFYAVWMFRKKTMFSVIWAAYVWLAYGLALFLDYPNALLLLPSMIYFAISAFDVRERKDSWNISFKLPVLYTAIFFVALIGLHGYYNALNFGGPTKLSGGLIGYKDILAAQKIKETKQQSIQDLQAEKSIGSFFTEYHFPTGFGILTFGLDRGLFLFSPIFLLALFGIFMRWPQLGLEKGVLLGFVGINVFLYSSWGDPWGGWAFGPRYLIPSAAILSLFIVYWLGKVRYGLIARIVTYLLLAYSSAVALLGAITTNQVPPKVEADYLKMKYNFLYNYDFLIDNHSSSYVYNTFLKKSMSLPLFFMILFASVMFVAAVLLFIIPALRRNEH